MIIEICEPEIVKKLGGNCLLLSCKIPNQISIEEKSFVTIFILMMFVVNILLIIINLLLVKKLEWNPLPNYISNLLLICHLFTTGT